MWFKYPIIVVLFLFFALLQNSFLQYFRLGLGLNLVFILFFILIFFEEKNDHETGFWAALIAGFLLDVFLPHYFGLSVVFLLAIYFLEKLSVYMVRGRDYAFSILSFSVIFIISLTVYMMLFYGASLLFGFEAPFPVSLGTIIGVIYNLVFACAGFYIYRVLVRNKSDNQLKLF